MTDLREAFLKAARENPQNDLSGQISSSAQSAVKAEAEDRKYLAMGRKFERLGYVAYAAMTKPLTFRGESIDTLRVQWNQVRPHLVSAPQERRIQLLTDFATGLHLTEDDLDFRYRDLFDAARMFTKQDLVRQSQLAGFDIKAQLLINAFSAYEGKSPQLIEIALLLDPQVRRPVALSSAIAEIANSL